MSNRDTKAVKESFNTEALNDVTEALESLQYMRIREAFDTLSVLRHKLVVQVRKEKQLETETLK